MVWSGLNTPAVHVGMVKRPACVLGLAGTAGMTKPDTPGRVMALDLGSRRIGVALSDAGRHVARGYATLARRSRQADWERFRAIIEAEGVTLVVIGLPLLRDGDDSATTTWVRDYAADCAAQLPTPVLLWDESLTSQQADVTLRAQGVATRRARAARMDAVAAAHILQAFLEAGGADAPAAQPARANR